MSYIFTEYLEFFSLIFYSQESNEPFSAFDLLSIFEPCSSIWPVPHSIYASIALAAFVVIWVKQKNKVFVFYRNLRQIPRPRNFNLHKKSLTTFALLIFLLNPLFSTNADLLFSIWFNRSLSQNSLLHLQLSAVTIQK